MSAADASECSDLVGLTVLAESLVAIEAAFCLTASVRPRVLSSDDRPPSVDGRLELGDGCFVGRRTSVLSLLRSNDWRGMPPEELDGRVGGDGGACPMLCRLSWGKGSANGVDLWSIFPLGSAYFE